MFALRIYMFTNRVTLTAYGLNQPRTDQPHTKPSRIAKLSKHNVESNHTILSLFLKIFDLFAFLHRFPLTSQDHTFPCRNNNKHMKPIPKQQIPTTHTTRHYAMKPTPIILIVTITMTMTVITIILIITINLN